MAFVSVSDELVYTLLVVERRKENTDRLDIEHWHESLGTRYAGYGLGCKYSITPCRPVVVSGVIANLGAINPLNSN